MRFVCFLGGVGTLVAVERKKMQRGRAEGRYIADQGGGRCCGKRAGGVKTT